MSTLSKLRSRIRGDFPLTLNTLSVDIGEPIHLEQDDVLALLMINPHDVTTEAALSPMLYAYFARFRRALDVQADDAVRAYAVWKSQKTEELARKMEPKVTKAGKPAAKQGPTGDEAAAHYRAQPDYQEVSRRPAVLKAQAALLEDIMWALKMKADMITSIGQTQGVHRSIDRQTDAATPATYESTPNYEDRQAVAAGQREAIAKVLLAPAHAPPPPKNPPPPVTPGS